MSLICLVQMPYSDLVRPSIALGLLKSYLSDRRIPTEVIYANLEYAAALGLDVYKAIEETPPESLIGEWTFSKAAFGDAVGDDGSSVDWMPDDLNEHAWFRV